MGDDNSMTDSTGGLGDFTGSQIGTPTDGQNASR